MPGFRSIVCAVDFSPVSRRALEEAIDLARRTGTSLTLVHGNGFTLKPFVGAGLGARTYDYRDLDIDSETDLAGYFSLGASLEYRNTMAGFTVRDYLSDYDGIGVEEGSSTRNDLSVFVSVGARF